MVVSTSTPAAAVSPLRQRMLDDTRMRQFTERTQDGYIRTVRKISAFLGRSPHTQLHLVDTRSGPVTINATITALKSWQDGETLDSYGQSISTSRAQSGVILTNEGRFVHCRRSLQAVAP